MMVDPAYNAKDEEIERLRFEVEALKETVSALNRRCQQAESAARETVEAIEKKGMSLGRGLANFAAGDYKRQNEQLRTALKEIVQVLGPKPPNCGCDGCGYEMSSALRTAQEALKS